MDGFEVCWNVKLVVVDVNFGHNFVKIKKELKVERICE